MATIDTTRTTDDLADEAIRTTAAIEAGYDWADREWEIALDQDREPGPWTCTARDALPLLERDGTDTDYDLAEACCEAARVRWDELAAG